ncbi:MAG: EamA-like transporter family protein [Alphaproteobacteria bacterium ADurb.Bin438]|nr:MAG: EamA-like transporter family protein [Alphaproteobacteria bacterium ADurb.Bin438]
MVEKYLWLVYALLAAVSAALVAIFGKIGLKGIDSNAATAIRGVIMALFLCGVVVAQNKTGLVNEIMTNYKALTFICLSGIAGALSWIFYFLALKHGEVSKVAPVDKLSVVFAIVIAVLFLGEKLSWIAGVGAVLLTTGVVMLALG